MEAKQLEDRLAWFDEQRRKYIEENARQNERLDAIERHYESSTRQLRDLSGEVSRLASLAGRVHQFDEALTKHREEVSRMLKGIEEDRRQRQEQLDEIRKADHAELSKALAKLQLELEGMSEVRQTLDARREEELRISRSLDALEKRLDGMASRDEDGARAILSLEEARRQEASRITDLQTEASDLRKRVITLQESLDSIEERTQRMATQISELSAREGQRRELLQTWTDQQALKLTEFERAWKEWERHLGAFEIRAQELDERMLADEQTYRDIKPLRNHLDSALERFERRITEVGETQRLAEDRFRQDWSSFQADAKKHWSMYELTLNEQRSEQERSHEKLTKEIQPLHEKVADALDAFAELEENSQRRLSQLLAKVSEWAAAVEQRPSQPG